jgi:hypothetical protein
MANRSRPRKRSVRKKREPKYTPVAKATEPEEKTSNLDAEPAKATVATKKTATDGLAANTSMLSRNVKPELKKIVLLAAIMLIVLLTLSFIF